MKVKTKILFFFFRIFQSVFLEASIRNFCLKYKFRIYIILECEIILKIQLTSEILPCHRIRCAFVRALGVDGRTRCTLHTAQFDWQTMFDLEFRFVYSLLIFMNIRVEIFEIFLYIYKLYIRFENCENSRSFGKYQIANLWISCIYKFVDTYAEFHNFLHILQILYIYICRSDWKILVDGCTSYVHYVLLLSIIYEIFNFTERGNWFWIEITADGENRLFIGEI